MTSSSSSSTTTASDGSSPPKAALPTAPARGRGTELAAPPPTAAAPVAPPTTALALHAGASSAPGAAPPARASASSSTGAARSLASTLSRRKGPARDTALAPTSHHTSWGGKAGSVDLPTTGFDLLKWKGPYRNSSGASSSTTKALHQRRDRETAPPRSNRPAWRGAATPNPEDYAGFETAPDPTSSTMPAMAWGTPGSGLPPWARSTPGALAADGASIPNPSPTTTFAGLHSTTAPAPSAAAAAASSTPSSAGPTDSFAPAPAPSAAAAAASSTPSSAGPTDSFAPAAGDIPAPSSSSAPSLNNVFGCVGSSYQGPGRGGASAAGGVAAEAFGAYDAWYASDDHVDDLRRQAAAAMDSAPAQAAGAQFREGGFPGDELRHGRRPYQVGPDPLASRLPTTGVGLVGPLPERPLCCDCLVRWAEVHFAPCGHIHLCLTCYRRRQRCPSCRMWIKWFPL